MPPDFQITLAELGYEEKTLTSPYDAIEYTLRLPEDWELREGSFFELDFDYVYNYIGTLEAQPALSFFGDVIIVIDGYRQQTFSIRETALAPLRLRVTLPIDLLNDPARRTHSIEVILDAGHICRIPHVASLTIHPTSFFSFIYDRVPLVPDLSRYPYPFYQRAFEPDQVRFVLPAHPMEMELTGAVGVAAKLGDLTYGMIISGTSDLELTERLEAGDALREHLIVIGRPENNEAILRLNELDALPLPVKERQLSLASQGPAAVAPGGILSYTLTLTNTTQVSISALSLVDTLPAYGQMASCDSACSDMEGEVSWSIPSLEAGEAFKCTVELRLSDVLTDSVVENTVTLLDAMSNPLNVNTLTTTVSTTPLAESGSRASVSTDEGYFFVHGEQGVPENDGVVQELVSPWDQARAILVITGLNNEAVHKAAQAMSFESRFPGMAGQFALVREVRPLPDSLLKPLSANMTFADLGYEDRVLAGYSQEANYYVDIPAGWDINREIVLDLHFGHSGILDYNSSYLNVLYNAQPAATIALNDETSLNGTLRVELPAAQTRAGQRNKITIQAKLHPVDKCVPTDEWLFISSTSLLHLDYTDLDVHPLNLDFYPHPFDLQSDLSDVLFVLPPEPITEEWEGALQLAAALGDDAGGPDLAPPTMLGNHWPETTLRDYHLIVMGRPLRNPLLRQVNAQLPQPFLPGSDSIEQKLNEVILRLPSDVSLGYVQLIPSPWSEERELLAVTGTTDEGVKWAMDVLTDRYWVLDGNLALIRDDEVNTIDTRGLTRGGMAAALTTAVPEMTLVSTATPTPLSLRPTPGSYDLEQSMNGTDRPAWLIPLVGVTGVAVIAIFAVAFWRSRRRKS